MQILLIFCAILVTHIASPNGFYHQEYNYRTSSSSYKNHELQHRNDDEGYYAKDGDLEGRMRPRVNAHSQHSEYVNPQLQHGYKIGTDRTSSFGQLHAQNQFRPFHGPEIGGGGYAVMGPPPQDYGVHSNLGEVTARLQQEMESELQRAVYDHYQRAAAYGGSVSREQMETDRRILEEELRRNLTMRMQEALKTHYGNQGIRGGYSYSIIDGRLQPVANYNNRELADLTRQMEMNLLKHLDQQVQTYYTRVDTEVHTRRNTYRINGVAGDNYPSNMEQRPVIYQPYQPPPYPQPHPQPYPQPRPPPQPHPVPPIPDSITTVATRVQTELNEILNKILEDTQRRYFSENAYNSGINYDSVLAQLQDELRANITFHFDDQIKRAYGYTNYASKYSVEDIENLRRQIETNLITKLNRDFNRQRERYFQTHHIYVTPRPIPANHVYYPMNYNADIATMQRQLQEQLSRQLQTALIQQSYRQPHMYGGGNFNAEAHYQATLQQLSAELNRNLTRQFELLNTQQFQNGAYAAQLAAMRNQLQHDLMRQLEHGLQQSFSRWSSWSSSSSHTASTSNTNYRPVRGFDQNVYNLMPEDCMMGDQPTTNRKKRSPPGPHDGLTQQTLDDPFQQVQTYDDLTQQPQTLYQNPTYIPPPQRYQTLQQPDLTQQSLTPIEQPPEQRYRQKYDSSSLTQQVQSPYEPLYVAPPSPVQQIQTYPPQRPSPYSSSQTSQSIEPYQVSDLLQSPESQVQTFDPLPSRPSPYSSQTLQPIDPYQVSDLSGRSPKGQVQTFEPPPPSQITYQRPVPVRYEQNTYRDRYESPRQYTSTYDWYLQKKEAEQNRVRQRVQYYESLQRQGNKPYYEPVYHNHQAVTRKPPYHYVPQQTSDSQNFVGQQSDLTQQSQQLGQQTEDDLDQLTQQQAQLYTDQQSQDLTQQSRSLGQPNQYVQQSQDLTQQTEDLTQQYQDLTQQSRHIPQQSQDLGQQSEDLTQHSQDLTQQSQHEDLTQQSEDLTQQSQDLTQQSQHKDLTQQNQDLTQQIEDLTQNKDLTQQSEDFTQSKDLYQQSEDLTQSKDLTQQSEDLTQQSEDLTQQSEDLTQQNEDLTQQTQDLTQQTQHLTPQQSGYLSQQTQDLIQDEINQYRQFGEEPTTIKSYTQHSEDLTQQSEDLTQEHQDLTQQTEDLTQQTQNPTHQSEDLTQQRSSEDLTQQRDDLTQQRDDLTQQSEDLTQQSDDLTQQSQDLTQQSDDLTQQTEDLTQQSEDLDLTQQTEEQTTIPPDQQRLREAQLESQHLLDLLRNQSGKNQQEDYLSYKPRPVYSDYNGHPVQVGETRRLPSQDDAQKVNYAHIMETRTETIEEIEPIEPQVADEVQTVDDPETPTEPEGTTQKPGFWTRFKQSVKNKLG